jgi:hypothetical protein
MPSMPNATSELREIYNMYRTATLNKLYYGRMLARYQKLNTLLEIMIAIGATSSGISGFTLWQEPYGKEIWGAITLVSGLLAIAKPIMQLNKKVERYSKLFTGHLDNSLRLGALVTHIRRKRDLSAKDIAEFEIAEQRFIELSREDDPHTAVRLQKKCEQEVCNAIPESALWFPLLRRPTRKRNVVQAKAPPADTGLLDSTNNVSEIAGRALGTQRTKG